MLECIFVHLRRFFLVRGDMKLRVVLVAMLAISAVGGTVFALEEPVTPLPDNVFADSIVVEKSTHRMNLFKNGELLRTYKVALGRGGPERKSQEGDARTPEGAYYIDSRNPQSGFHRALHVSYPDANDVAAAQARGVSAGSDVLIHGIRNRLGWLGRLHRLVDWTAGCIAVTDGEMDEIWRVVPDGTPILIKPR
jgi:murein L,D-transpeptidase YafK